MVVPSPLAGEADPPWWFPPPWRGRVRVGGGGGEKQGIPSREGEKSRGEGDMMRHRVPLFPYFFTDAV